MPKVKVGDINIYCEVHGKGEALVLIMGLGADISAWFRLIPVLSQEYQVIAFDNRGAGQSDKPDIPYATEMMADDLVGLLETIGIDTAHIFGVSMGGTIAQHFALRYRNKVTSLILGCTTCGGPHSVSLDEEAASFLSPERLQTLSVEERIREMFPFLYSREFIDKNPDFIEERVAVLIEHPPHPIGYARQSQALMNHDTYQHLPEIKAPTLVITGDADRLIPVENSRILATRIPRAELVILEKMGHGFFTEAGDETSKILLDFIKRNNQQISSS